METPRFLSVVHAACSTLLAFGAVVSFCISDADLIGVLAGVPFVTAASVVGALFTRRVGWSTVIGASAGTAGVTSAALALIFAQLLALDAIGGSFARELAFQFALGCAGAAVAGAATGSALVAGNRVRVRRRA
jgi:hypothetical protein